MELSPKLGVKRFQVDKILSCFAGSKRIAVVGHYDECEEVGVKGQHEDGKEGSGSNQAVIVLEQVAFDRNLEEIQALLRNTTTAS